MDSVNVRHAGPAKAFVAAGVLGVALPAFAVGLAGSAAAEMLPAAVAGPQPCSPNAEPTPGSAWLTSQEFSCLEVSYTADAVQVEPGDSVDYTLQIKAPGNYMYHNWLPIHLADALTEVEMTTAPVLSTALSGDAQAPQVSLTQFGDDYALWLGDIAGGGFGDGEGGWDPDTFVTLTLTFTAQVGADAADGTQVSSWVGAPLRANSEFDTDGVTAALAEPLVGCSSTFVDGQLPASDPDFFGMSFGGDWVPDASSQSGPLCATFAVAIAQEPGPVEPTADPSVPVAPEVEPSQAPIVDPTPAQAPVVSAAPAQASSSTTAHGAQLANTGASSGLGMIGLVAGALTALGAILAFTRRQIARRS